MAEPSADYELGDPVFSDGDVLTLESDGLGVAGDAVTISDGQVTPTVAEDDDFIGCLYEDAPDAGEGVSVNLQGIVVANVASGVAAGDTLVATTTEGQLVASAAGTTQAVDEGGTASYTLAMAHPIALTDAGAVDGLSAGGGLNVNAAIVKLP